MVNEVEPKYPIEKKDRFFYGYIIVIASLCIMIAVFGVRFAFGVFFKPMATQFDWSSAETSAAYSISMLVEGLTGVVMGAITDRFGPRFVLTFSGFLLGVGYLAMSQVSALWQFYIFYGVIIGVAMGGFIIPLVTTVNRWFIKRRGIMTGVLWSGTGIGMLIISPASNWLIYNYSWQTCYLILGGVIMVIVILAAQFLKRDPTRAGQLPYGEFEADAHKHAGTGALTLHEATRTLQFWLLIVMFICFGFCVFAVTVHVVPSAIERGLSAASSANILAIVGLIRILGGLGLGNIADRIGNRWALIASLVLMTVALFWLVPTTEFWAFALFGVIFGLGYGGTSAAQSPLVAQLFGLKSHGLIYGFCGLSYTIGGALGPFISGYLHDATRSYPIAFLVSAVLGVIAILAMVVIRPSKKTKP